MYTSEHKEYLKKIKRNKIFIQISRIIIGVFFLIFWELAANYNLLNSFLTSKPTIIFKTIINLLNNNLLRHIYITFKEVLISFALASIIGFTIASIMWFNRNIAKIIDPYLTILNSLPKVALGPLIMIWCGANIKSIIFIAVTISVFITIINIYNYFINVDKYYITLLKSLNASRIQIFSKLIVPSNKKNIINCLKVNISMSLIGVIMGELLVSKEGLGYLIMYGSQVFNINLVITSIFLLAILSYIMYKIIYIIEKNS